MKTSVNCFKWTKWRNHLENVQWFIQINEAIRELTGGSTTRTRIPMLPALNPPSEWQGERSRTDLLRGSSTSGASEWPVHCDSKVDERVHTFFFFIVTGGLLRGFKDSWPFPFWLTIMTERQWRGKNRFATCRSVWKRIVLFLDRTL